MLACLTMTLHACLMPHVNFTFKRLYIYVSIVASLNLQFHLLAAATELTKSQHLMRHIKASINTIYVCALLYTLTNIYVKHPAKSEV